MSHRACCINVMAWPPAIQWRSTVVYIGWKLRLEATGVAQPCSRLWLSAWPWQRNRNYVGNKQGPRGGWKLAQVATLVHSKKQNVLPPLPCTLKKDVLNNEEWHCLSPYKWLLLFLLCWKRTCVTATSFMELKSTFPQSLLITPRGHSRGSAVTSTTDL